MNPEGAHQPPWEDLGRLVATALAEDLPAGDPTGESVGARQAQADLVARRAGCACGLVAAELVLDEVSRKLHTGVVDVRLRAADGDEVRAGQVLALFAGPADALLAGERTMLNLIAHLSGVATATRAMVEAVAGTGAVIRDTRKTLAGFRAAEKYAVRCGGGANHRMSLSDAVLVKDNHVAAMGGVTAAVAAAKLVAAGTSPPLDVEVEVDDLTELDEALAAGAELVLVDNMPTDAIAEAVRRAHARGAKVEASGGVTLGTVRAVAECGVDYIAVGSITHSAGALDVALDWRFGPLSQ
ncbi:MAG TPA: carboxylating nicotinate-nucleotide diphosphorylase [Acidimicrobiales bacterium]|nr:carboxylating nicotinate-nucleotide diphosphorylase [Acidimicrobiales bacterium]